MDWKLELVAVPVSDVDRAKSFYVDQVGFNEDHDHQVSDDVRFVQLTPPGSACSIALGKGIVDAQPGTVQGLQLVVPDIEIARAELVGPWDRRQRDPGLPLGPVRVLRRSGRKWLVSAAGSDFDVVIARHDRRRIGANSCPMEKQWPQAVIFPLRSRTGLQQASRLSGLPPFTGGREAGCSRRNSRQWLSNRYNAVAAARPRAAMCISPSADPPESDQRISTRAALQCPELFPTMEGEP